MATDGRPESARFRARDNVVTGRFASARPGGGEPRDSSEGAAGPESDSGPASRTNLAAEHLGAAIELGYRPLSPRREVVTDAYWDTAAFDILRSGYAFRLRGTAAGAWVTLESLDRAGFDDVAMQRVEVGGPVEEISRALDPASWPEVVRDRVREAAGEPARLLPVCVLHQRRERIPLAAGDPGEDRVVAELSLDVVDVFDPAGMTGGSVEGVARLLEDSLPVTTFSELEIEPAEAGAPAVLRDLAKRLRSMPDLAPAAGGKLEQGLRVLADHPPGAAPGELGITAGMPMTEAGRLMWRRQLIAMLLNEAGARRGKDIEYVHDMRVATRRARAVARLFGPFFRRKVLRAHLDNLRRTTRALGAVRDLDVALENLRKCARSRPPAEQPGLGEIGAVWRLERRQAYRALLTWLDGSDYRGFVAGFAELCRTAGLGARSSDPGSDGGPLPTRVGHVMPSAILQRFEQVRSYEPRFASAAPVPVATLHALRIDCKALRYSLEPVDHLLGDEGREIIKELKRLQDLLGDLQDAAVADARLADLADVVEPGALAAYRAHQQAVLADRVAAAPAAWRAFVAPDNRRKLALAIARL